MDPNVPTADATPAADTPAVVDVAPAAAVEAAPAVVEAAPVVAPAEAAPAEVAAAVAADAPKELPASDPSLLEKFDAEKAKPAETKPAEVKPEAKAAEVKPEGEKAPVAEPAPLEPVEYKYELPPTLKMDDTLKGEVHTAFDDFRRDPAAGAQRLIDLHAKSMQEYADQVAANQITAWNETKAGWARDAMADEQIGGSGHNTAMGAIARMRDMFVPESDRESFGEFLKITGAGSHPAFLRMMHNAARFYDEPPMPSQAPKPPPNNGRAPGSKRAIIYDHPTSQPRNS